MTTDAPRYPETSIRAQRAIEGVGPSLRRVIPAEEIDAVGPFIFLDHFGPIYMPPGEAKGAPEHPHAGIETLSYLLEGRMRHMDGMGNVSSMGPGEVQWMRSGRGLVHDEGPDEEVKRTGGRIHGFQFWLNMPRGHKHDEPVYCHYTAEETPSIESDGARLTVITGEVAGLRGPVETFGRPFLAHLRLSVGSGMTLDLPGPERALYVATGAVRIEGVPVGEAMLLPRVRHSSISVCAEEASDVIFLGGAPLDSPIIRYGPFVMNEHAELAQAIDDYQAGRMGRISR